MNPTPISPNEETLSNADILSQSKLETSGLVMALAMKLVFHLWSNHTKDKTNAPLYACGR
jgi:hypothetical protein